MFCITHPLRCAAVKYRPARLLRLSTGIPRKWLPAAEGPAFHFLYGQKAETPGTSERKNRQEKPIGRIALLSHYLPYKPDQSHTKRAIQRPSGLFRAKPACCAAAISFSPAGTTRAPYKNSAPKNCGRPYLKGAAAVFKCKSA